MTPEQLLCRMAKILEKLDIPYIITGGFAVAVLAKPRYTADIDIVIELIPQKVQQLTRELLSLGKDVYVSEEAIGEALKHKGEFNFIHPQSGLKVDFWLKRYPFEQFQSAVIKNINGQKVKFISPEDLILAKLIWFKESESSRHLEDIRAILDVQKNKLDLNYIKNWARRQSTIKILEEIIRNF